MILYGRNKQWGLEILIEREKEREFKKGDGYGRSHDS